MDAAEKPNISDNDRRLNAAVPESKRSEIIELHEAGNKVAAIVGLTDITQEYIYAVLKVAGFQFKLKGLSPTQKDEIFTRVEKGEKPSSLAKEYGVRPVTISENHAREVIRRDAAARRAGIGMSAASAPPGTN